MKQKIIFAFLLGVVHLVHSMEKNDMKYMWKLHEIKTIPLKVPKEQRLKYIDSVPNFIQKKDTRALFFSLQRIDSGAGILVDPQNWQSRNFCQDGVNVHYKPSREAGEYTVLTRQYSQEFSVYRTIYDKKLNYHVDTKIYDTESGLIALLCSSFVQDRREASFWIEIWSKEARRNLEKVVTLPGEWKNLSKIPEIFFDPQGRFLIVASRDEDNYFQVQVFQPGNDLK